MRWTGCATQHDAWLGGFIVLFDYGHEARELYSVSHSAGTLTTFARHTMAGPEVAQPSRRGSQTRAARTSRRTSISRASVAAAEAEGLATLGFLDQTYFLMGILLASSWNAGV